MVIPNILRTKTASALLRPYRSRVLALCLCTALSSILQVVMAFATRQLVDAALEKQTSLLLWGSIMIAILLALVILHATVSWVGGRTSEICMADLRRAVLARAVYAEGAELSGYHSGELLNRSMEDVRTLCDGMVNVIPSMVGQLVRLGASFAAAVLLFPSVTWLIAMVAVFVVIGAAIFRPLMKKRQMDVRKADAHVMTALQEDLQNLELIKSLGAEQQSLKRFDLRLTDFLKALLQRRVLYVGRNTLISAVSQLGTGALLIWGATRIAGGIMTYGTMAAMLQLIALLRNPVFGLSGLWTRMAAVDVAGERLEQILSQKEEQEETNAVTGVNQIVLENVTFAYPGENVPVLENFSCRFDLNHWVCLTGISGKGKTTLFKLILGLYQPQEGRVYLNTPQGEVPCGPGTRHLFSYVPQNYALLSGSILDNLLLASPNATHEQIVEALKLAQADFVWSLPAGENTLVQENNAGLSMGQLQRLAVARAFLMDRPILLLDECTSALDLETESALLSTVLSMNKCGILVTHHPDAVMGKTNVIMKSI